jgi:NMD protein affecting ribosome stability and mRNA decay
MNILSVLSTEGLDFYYGAQQDARKLVDFLSVAVPCRFG